MSDKFPIHTLDTAPSEAKPSLEAATAAFGFVPNLIGVMASSPALTEAYLTLFDIFENKTSLDAAQRQVVLLAVSRYHECRYCVADHSMIAEMQHVPAEAVEAIRNDQPIPDSKLEALRRLVTSAVENRGWVPDAELEAFYAAGYTPGQLLDALVGVAQKTLSNFTNHIAATPLDEPMNGHAWSPE
ncbi:MAG: carboxymuconolactone decarboxylase family protein [Pseudomonadota bacterium]